MTALALITIGTLLAPALSLSSQALSSAPSSLAAADPIQAISSFILDHTTSTGVASLIIGAAGVLLAIRRERKRSHIEIFLVKGSSEVHIKNVGSTDALDLEANVFDVESDGPIRSLKGQQLRREGELKVPLAGTILPTNRKLYVVVSYRNSNDKENKVRKKKRELLFLPGLFEGTDAASEVVTSEEVPGPKQMPSRNRIAVLPLANISPDPSDEYFADGMTEELIDKLSQVGGLRVIARTSVMSYKKVQKKASEIGRELMVGTLVEGSVRKAYNKIRITVQLIDTATEEHLWSSGFDRDLDDVFAVQSEIAEKVASELRVQLLDSEKLVLERKPTENTEAYTLFLKGRSHWNERTKEDMDKAVTYFEEAIKRAPAFALAHSALADCYVVSPDFGWQRPEDAYPKAKEHSMKAIELDPGLAEPHASLGLVFDMFEFKWHEAEEELKRALELKASYATAHHWYSVHLRIIGRLQESLEQIKFASELDPLSRVIGQNVGEQLLAMGSYKEGAEQFERVIAGNPEYAGAHCYLGWARYLESKPKEALDEMRKAVVVSRKDPFYEAQLACLLGFTGRLAEADSLIEGLKAQSAVGYIDKVTIAFALFGTGRTDEAFSFLEKGYNEASHLLFYFRTMPWFKQVWGDPRWVSFEERLGLRQA